MKEHCCCLEGAGENPFLCKWLQSHELYALGFPTLVSLWCCRAAHKGGKSLPKYLQNGNCGYSWKPEFFTGSLSSLLHLLNPRKLVIKITHRLVFLGTLPSVLIIVLDFHLEVVFFFKLMAGREGLERRESPQMPSQEAAGWAPLSFCGLCPKEPC